MATTTSMRRTTVKLKNRRRPRPKAPELFKNTTSTGGSVFGAGDGYVSIDPMAGKNGWQRHPEVQIAVASLAAIGLLAALIYMLPQSQPEASEEIKPQATATQATTPLTVAPGKRAAPTDASFLATPYNKTPSPPPPPVAQNASRQMMANSTHAETATRTASVNTPPDGTRYGDGAVTFDKRKGSCNVEVGAGGNFATALVDCVNGALAASSGPRAP